MTFQELEKICKRRRLYKKVRACVLAVLFAAVGIGVFYINKKNQKIPAGKKSIKQDNNIIEKNIIINKTANKANFQKKPTALKKIPKQKLELVLDLNFTEIENNHNINKYTLKEEKPKYKEKKPQPTKSKEQQTEKKPLKSANQKNYIIKSNTLPSYETCIKLSEKYFKEGKYNESLKWAKNANIQNKKDPLSWIMSAKSLYKLGKKSEAVKILKIYYNYRKDKEVEKLLREWNAAVE